MQQRTFRSGALMALVLSTLVLTGCGGGGGGSVTETNSVTEQQQPEAITYVLGGNVKTEDETPIEGALVSVDGIEAEQLTDANGGFSINSEHSFGPDAVVTVTKDNFRAFSATFAINNAEQANHFVLAEGVTLFEQEPWGFLDIETGTGDKAFKGLTGSSSFNEQCDCVAEISGRALKKGNNKSKLYAMLVLDASGSTNNLTEAGKRIFDVEVESLLELLDTLEDKQNTYVGLIQFAQAAQSVVEFTNDLALVRSALLEVEPEVAGSTGAATNYQAALELVQASFAAANLKQRDIQTVAFLSDGIPTAPFGSGTTQEPEDRAVALEAAGLTAAAGISVNTFPVNVDSKLSTLPAISAITDGRYYEHELSNITTEISGDSLVGVERIDIVNTTTDQVALETIFKPDGRFSSQVCLTGGDTNLIQITPVLCEGCDTQAYQKINLGCETQQCGQCAGQVTSLTLTYQGPLESVDVVVTQRKNARQDYILFQSTVAPGEEFTFFGAKRDKTMGSKINVYVNGDFNGEFVTSCGQPKIGPGRISGDFVVSEGYSRNGGLLCPID